MQLKADRKLIISNILTNSSGACSATIERVSGRLIAIQFILDTLASGAVDVSVVESNFGSTIFTKTNAAADVLWRPRVQLQDTSGSNISFYEPILLIDATLTITVAQGGDTKTGKLKFWME